MTKLKAQTAPNKTRLKPCPCCGSSDLIRELAVNDRIWVKCTSCTMMGWAEDWDNRADHIPDTSKMMWISVDDRLPDDDRLILVANANSKAIISAICVSGIFVGFGSEGMFNLADITHWMPLPEPPVQNES